MKRLLALGALVGVLAPGCAGRGERAERPAAEVTTEASLEEPHAPAPAEVPPLLRCAADADCRLSQFLQPVAAVADCYCPECPQPLAAVVAAAHEADWQLHCGEEWQATRRCFAPMCPPLPGPLACLEGRCGYRATP